MPPTSEPPCPFCSRIADDNVAAATALAVAIPDALPVSPGHTLIVPRRHVAGWFELPEPEQAAVLALANAVQRRVAEERAPDGWNIGVNVGAAGGQTIGHVHLHLIPRYAGDRADARGGVRWILPDRAPYWREG